MHTAWGVHQRVKVCTHLLPHTFGADAGPTCLRESWGMLGSPQAARLQFRQLQLTKLAHSAYVEGRLDGIAISPVRSSCEAGFAACCGSFGVCARQELQSRA